MQNYTAGATGQVLTSTGTGWASQASNGGQLQTQLFTAPGTWTKPASCTQVRVTVVGGGGAGAANPGSPGGSGGYAKAIVPVSAPVSITVGGAGTYPGGSGGTSSFGPAVSSTGGVANANTPGTGTVSVGTNLRTSFANRIGDSLLNGASLGVTTAAGEGGVAFSVTAVYGAGFQGASGSGPVSSGKGGIGGAVLVEFVG
jgi:hypothetical protein